MLITWLSWLEHGERSQNSTCVHMNIDWKDQSRNIYFFYFILVFSPRPVVGRFKMNFTIDVSGCQDGTPVLYLEHVQVVATIRYGKRGDLKLTLYSPSGTESVLLPPRPQV